MRQTRVDVDLLNYHHMLVNKPQIEEVDIQNLLDAYREKFSVDLVFAAECLMDSNQVELTHISCHDHHRHHLEELYFGPKSIEENELHFDEDGLCTYGISSYNMKAESAVLHYGVFHQGKHIGSIGMYNYHGKWEWTAEERLAVQKLGRILKSGIYLNRSVRINASDQDIINQQSHALEAFFATTDCGILLHTLDGKTILSVNQAALQLLDYDSQEEMEQHFHMIAPSVLEEDQKKLKDTVRRLKKVGDHGNVGYRVRHKNGNIIDIMGQVKLVEENGQLVCQRVMMDCTEQRLYEKKKLQEKEAKKNQMISDALKQAEQASQAKTRFLSNISHDIRTPMNAIIGYTALAKSHIDHKEQVHDYLNKISTSSEYLLNLINDVLDMSRIESGNLSLDPTPCSLVEILNDLKTVMAGQLQDRHQTFDLEIKGLTNEMVLCDKLRLNQILLNILGNAVKFTPDGGEIQVFLYQFARNEAESLGGYRFHIRDNGIGMSEDFKEHLFEQFSREKRDTVNEIPGTGLGMAITKSLVEKMGGTIQVESQLGEGTEFILSFDFPIYQTESAAPTKKNKGAAPITGQKPKRLLLVEDNALNQEIASEILSDYGFLIEIANDGSEAVKKMENANPGDYDIILMDIQMPVMNGYEATKRIRMLENPHLASIPIIAMTANAFDEDKKKAFHAGMNDFVSKPIDVENLLSVISSITEACG